jgi:hypothetical protein
VVSVHDQRARGKVTLSQRRRLTIEEDPIIERRPGLSDYAVSMTAAA